MSAPNCTTHHYACDCREAMFAEMVKQLSIACSVIDRSKIIWMGMDDALASIARATDQGDMK